MERILGRVREHPDVTGKYIHKPLRQTLRTTAPRCSSRSFQPVKERRPTSRSLLLKLLPAPGKKWAALKCIAQPDLLLDMPSCRSTHRDTDPDAGHVSAPRLTRASAALTSSSPKSGAAWGVSSTTEHNTRCAASASVSPPPRPRPTSWFRGARPSGPRRSRARRGRPRGRATGPT